SSAPRVTGGSRPARCPASVRRARTCTGSCLSLRVPPPSTSSSRGSSPVGRTPRSSRSTRSAASSSGTERCARRSSASRSRRASTLPRDELVVPEAAEPRLRVLHVRAVGTHLPADVVHRPASQRRQRLGFLGPPLAQPLAVVVHGGALRGSLV